MKRLLVTFLTLLFCVALILLTAPDARPSTVSQANTNAKPAAAKRAPVFRSTKEQIKQAQALLRTRGFYSGQEDGKLNADTRAALRKYQEAENIKVTGTLNKATLERMGVSLTDRQKEWKPAP